MRRMIIAVLTLGVLAVPSCALGGEWYMRVHTGGDAASYATSDVDSVTFVYDYTPELVFVAGDTFTYGDGEARCGAYEYEAWVDDFYIGQHEVTNAEYTELLQWAYDQGYVTVDSVSVRDTFDGSTEELVDLDAPACRISFADGVFSCTHPTHPVTEVTWYGAVSYCDWLSLSQGLPRAYEHVSWYCNWHAVYDAVGYRLPTDAEWECAASYSDDRVYPTSSWLPPNCDKANFTPDSVPCVGGTVPVGSYPNAPPSLGLADMAGNVREWCNDYITPESCEEPEWPPGPDGWVGPMTGVARVVHGGGWSDELGHLRCAARIEYIGPSASSDVVGFRIARSGD